MKYPIINKAINEMITRDLYNVIEMYVNKTNYYGKMYL